MASLDDILSETYLFQARRERAEWEESTTSPIPPKDFFSKPSSWTWAGWSVKPDLISVQGLKHRHVRQDTTFLPLGKKISTSTSLICEKIEWHPVQLTIRGRRVNLLYDTGHFMAAYFLRNGRFIENDTDKFWRLGSRVVAGVLMVFGYSLNLREGSLTPVPQEAAPCLIPDPAPEWLGSSKCFITGKKHLVETSQPRVIVCVSLVCCAPKNDWDPGQGVIVARLIPHTMVMTNFDMPSQDENSLRSDILLQRPATIGHHSSAWDHSEMNHTTELLLVADSNSVSNAEGLEEETEGFPNLKWDVIFDYFDDRPPLGEEIVVVDPSKEKERQVPAGLVSYDNPARKNPPNKVVRQGEFDNLHMAPTMRHPRLGGSKENMFPGGATKSELINLKMDRIVMAPICEHDCLHMHWRWGDPFKGKWVSGWSDDGPHTAPGAPMVPKNQKVSIKLSRQDNKPAVRISTLIEKGIHSGEWQVINPQGAGYAVDSNWKGWMTEKVSFGWWSFYWHNRYETILSKGGLFEQRRVIEAKERITIFDLGALRKS